MSHINDTLKRINELAAKKKSGQELTPEELAEKKELYEIYLSFIRGQITSTLDRVEFIDPETGERTYNIWILFNCCFSIGRISKYNIIKS